MKRSSQNDVAKKLEEEIGNRFNRSQQQPPLVAVRWYFYFYFYFVNLYIQVVAMVDICQGFSSAQLNFLFEIIILNLK